MVFIEILSVVFVFSTAMLFVARIPLSELGRAIFLFSLFIRICVSLCNSYFFVTPGAEDDALRFHTEALDISARGDFSFGIDSVFYENLLGLLYYVFDGSILLGSLLSIISFCVSVGVFVKFMVLFGMGLERNIRLAIYCFLPSSILFGSVTLRESHQVMFFMASICFCFISVSSNRKFLPLVGMIFFTLLLGVTHKGLFYFSFLLIFFNLIFVFFVSSGSFFLGSRVEFPKFLFVGLLFLPILFVFWDLEGGWGGVASIAEYRGGAESGRTSYGDFVNFDNPYSAIFGFVLLIFYYLLSPLPWQISDALDILPFLESVLRVLLLYYSVVFIRGLDGKQKYMAIYLMVLFFLLSLMWSLGTTSYGTAIRHHLVASWILVLLGGGALGRALSRFFSIILRFDFFHLSGRYFRS